MLHEVRQSFTKPKPIVLPSHRKSHAYTEVIHQVSKTGRRVKAHK